MQLRIYRRSISIAANYLNNLSIDISLSLSLSLLDELRLLISFRSSIRKYVLVTSVTSEPMWKYILPVIANVNRS